MCPPAALAIAAATVSAAGQLYSGFAANAAGKAEANAMRQNLALERARAVDARERANVDIMQRYREASQAVGRMRADQAALGLDTEYGSVFDNQMATLRIAGEDVDAIGRNATTEIRGYDINIANLNNAASAARSRGKSALFGSVLGAVGSAIGGAQQVRKFKAAHETGVR